MKENILKVLSLQATISPHLLLLYPPIRIVGQSVQQDDQYSRAISIVGRSVQQDYQYSRTISIVGRSVQQDDQYSRTISKVGRSVQQDDQYSRTISIVGQSVQQDDQYSRTISIVGRSVQQDSQYSRTISIVGRVVIVISVVTFCTLVKFQFNHALSVAQCILQSNSSISSIKLFFNQVFSKVLPGNKTQTKL